MATRLRQPCPVRELRIRQRRAVERDLRRTKSEAFYTLTGRWRPVLKSPANSIAVPPIYPHLPAARWSTQMLTSTLSSRLKWPVLLDYGIACVMPVMAVALDVSLSRLWGIDPPASVLLCGIMIVAWVSGPGPALLATALTVLAFDYVLLQPIYSLTLEFNEFPRLALLTTTALLVVSLNTARGRATASLQRARDDHQDTLHELQKLNDS